MWVEHRAVLQSLYTLLSIMAHVAGQEDREKTTALKGQSAPGRVPRLLRPEGRGTG